MCLSGEASLAQSVELFAQVPYFKCDDIEPEFLSRAALQLSPRVLVPRENVASDCLTIVFSGLVAKDGVCGIRCFGDDMVLSNRELRRLSRAMALTLVQLQRLTREDFDDLLTEGQCPQAQRCVRKWCIQTTMQRVVLAMAKWAKENTIDAGDEPNLQETFYKMKQSLGWLTGSTSAPEEHKVGRSPVEARIHEVGESVVKLSTRVDELGGTMQQAVNELVALREGLKKSHERKASRMIMLAAETTVSSKGSPHGDATDSAMSSEVRCCKSRPPEHSHRRDTTVSSKGRPNGGAADSMMASEVRCCKSRSPERSQRRDTSKGRPNGGATDSVMASEVRCCKSRLPERSHSSHRRRHPRHIASTTSHGKNDGSPIAATPHQPLTSDAFSA